MKTTLEKIAEKHDDWHRIVLSFGCKKSIAEDIVQEMYLKVSTLIDRGLDINFKDEINYFYIYKTLQTLFYDLHRKESKLIKVDIKNLENYIEDEIQSKDKNICKAMNSMDNILDNLFWYDRTVFEIISNGTSIADLARKTNITYASLYNTYKNVKNVIKKNIEWD